MTSASKASRRSIKSSNAAFPDLITRKRRSNVVSLDDVTAQEVKDWGSTFERPIAEYQANRILSLTISELGSGPHVVFVLRPTEQLSIRKIAQTLGLSVPAVKSRLRRVPLG